MTFNITRTDLDLADDRRYQDHLIRSAFNDGKTWGLMLEPERIDRTAEVIFDLRASLERQLGAAKEQQGGGDPLWRRRTLNLLHKVNTYQADVKSEIKRLDKEEADEGASGERDRWREIAATLAGLLRGNPALDLVLIPVVDGEVVSVAGWLDIRDEKAEKRERGEEAA